MYLKYNQYLKKKIKNKKKKKKDKIEINKQIINKYKIPNSEEFPLNNDDFNILPSNAKDSLISFGEHSSHECKEFIEGNMLDCFRQPNFKSLNELEDYNDIYDDRDISEFNRDLVNNNLMDRLNSDIDIKNFGIKKVKNNLIPPYINNAGDNFAPFNSNNRNIKNFSNIKSNKKLNNNPVKGRKP